MTPTSLWKSWQQLRSQVRKGYIWAMSEIKVIHCHRWINIQKIWSRVAGEWLWLASGNHGSNLVGFKTPKSTTLPYLKPKAQIATDEHRFIKTHQTWSKDARGWLWQSSGIPESSLVGFKSPESIFVPYLKPKAQSATNEHRWIKNHRSKDAAEGLWQPSGIPRTSLKA